MVVPFLLLLVSFAGAIVGYVVPGLSDLLLLAVPWALASLILLVRAAARDTTEDRRDEPEWPRPRPRPSRPARKTIIVDGSNVLHWKDNTPRIETLREVVQHLSGIGFTPGVVFDANAGYLVAGRYQNDAALGAALGIPAANVMVVPKGTQADAIVLAAARDHGARIVSNDRYRDWADRHPEVLAPGHVVRGAFRDSGLWLDWGERPA